MNVLMQKIGSIFTSSLWTSVVIHACGAAAIILSFPDHAKGAAAGIIAFAIPKEFWWDVKFEIQASKRAAYIGGAEDFAGYALGCLYALWRLSII